MALLSLLWTSFCFMFSEVDGLSASMATSGSRFIGFDLGTSGARISVVENRHDGLQEVLTNSVPWGDPSQNNASSSGPSYDDPTAWMNAIETLLLGAAKSLKDQGGLTKVQSVCCSGTSASCLVVDIMANRVTRKPRMYNYDVVGSRERGQDPIYALKAIELLDKHAPPKHTARATSGSLAKLLTWNEEKPFSPHERICHQADYVAMLLQANDMACGAGPTNKWIVASDWHNCLKLGYDVQKDEWPKWMENCLQEATNNSNNPLRILPQKVISPGQPTGTISEVMANRFGLPKDTVIVGGTTDSNAGFFAAAGGRPVVGTAVTSLGSTLAIKYLSQDYVEDADRGVYSHRFPSVFFPGNHQGGKSYWLAGGASNVGCAVLRQQAFSSEELVELSNKIDPNQDSALEYYPLVKKGERFPIADSNKEPVLSPVPDSRQDFLHGILQGISDVERDGFQILAELGATPARPSIVFTCGGGSRNHMWSRMRERRLNQAFDKAQSAEQQQPLKVVKAENIEAGFGAAILASATFLNQ